MKRFYLKLTVPLIIALTCVYILVFQPDVLFLGAETLRMPLGSLIAWIAVIAYSFLFYALFPSKNRKSFHVWIRKGLWLNIIFALSWGVVSTLLAGNTAFSFQDIPLRSYIWIFFTGWILFIPLLSFLLLGLLSVFWKKTKH